MSWYNRLDERLDKLISDFADFLVATFNFSGKFETRKDYRVFSVLKRLDAGYNPTETQSRLLQEQTELNLSAYRIKALPDSIGMLVNLERLDLGFTIIDSLPEAVYDLKNLRVLVLSYTRITTIPESIGQLINLERLDLSKTEITALPDSIGKLVKLKDLNLGSTKIVSLPASIEKLANLQEMNLESTPLKEFPKSLVQLSNLQYLDLSSSNIRTLPKSISQLTNLKGLYLNHTPIESLPQALWQIQNLRSLHLQRCNISTLSEAIGQLINLDTLDISSTNITSLPEAIGELTSLQRVDLSNLTLPIIPKSLVLRGLPFIKEQYWFRWEPGINIYNVNLTEKTEKTFIQYPELIPSLYYKKPNLRTVKECRIIFLGDGGSGKTYTIKRFRNQGKKEVNEKTYQTSETPGVEILDYHMERGENSIDIHFWDFGGQQLLHSMHRCFLSEGSCYVVTVKTRETKANERACYWLRSVTAVAPHSPIILYINCWEDDDGLRTIDTANLREMFPNIQVVVYCSAKRATEESFREKIIEPILSIAATTEGIARTVPIQWIEIRKAIESESVAHNYLSGERYQAICAENGIEEDQAQSLLEYFSMLGICFSYHADGNRNELNTYKLLNPVWLTNGLYAIIEEGMVHAVAGQISRAEIEQMLCNSSPAHLRGKNYHRTVPDLVYQPTECQFIIDVAIAHDLCYPVNNNTLFFPSLCSANTPNETIAKLDGFGSKVSYLLRYNYLPDSVLHQLMIRCLRNRISVESCWQRGMVLFIWTQHRVIVQKNDDESLRIDVWSSKGKTTYELFWLLRKDILEVNKKLNLQAKEFVLDEADEFALEAILQAAEDDADLYGRCGKQNARVLLERFYEQAATQTMQVNDSLLIIPITAREFHPCPKENKALRFGLYEAYNRICPYCGNHISSLREMQVDHIFPTKYKDNQSLRPYLEYLLTSGFDIEKPDYIENYFPSHSHCNRDKSNRVSQFSLPYWHDIAYQQTPNVLRLMEKYKE